MKKKNPIRFGWQKKIRLRRRLPMNIMRYLPQKAKKEAKSLNMAYRNMRHDALNKNAADKVIF